MFASGYQICLNESNLLLQAYQEKVPLPWVKYVIDVLKNLPTIQWEKYFMSAEIQRVVPTCTGLPWQIGLVHIAHTKIAGDGKAICFIHY